MVDWLKILLRLREQREPCVLVTVAEVQGSTPRDAGTKMVVTEDASLGTIGGGQLEYEALGFAREMLASREPAFPQLRRFGLGPSLGQCCGGSARVLFEPIPEESEPWEAALREAAEGAEAMVLVTAIDGQSGGKLVVGRDVVVGSLAHSRHHAEAVEVARALLESAGAGVRFDESAEATLLYEPIGPAGLHVVLFGAGHVGRALVRMLGELPCRVTWIDGRAEQYPAEVPANVTIDCTQTPQHAVDRAPQDAAFLVMTHNHALDLKLSEKILERNDFCYFGLIGSATKRAKFIRRFKARGISEAVIDRMVCPIGIPGLSGKHPGEIAVAVAAQLLATRAEGTAAGGRAPAATTAAQGAGSR